MKAKIIGSGKYVPEKILTNQDLEKMVDTNDEWITRRVGIKERHIVGEGETASTLGAKAAEIAIERANINKDDIDMVIASTFTGDSTLPATACLIQNILKIPDAGTFDINAACTGFIYGLSVASSYIKSGIAKNVLLIGVDVLSSVTDWEDRGTCVLFGDGAGAAVITATEDDDESGIIDFILKGDGQYRDMLYIDAGGSAMPASHETVDKKLHYVKMSGNSTAKLAITKMSDLFSEITKRNGYSFDDVKLMIPHQANARIIESTAERINFPKEKVLINIDKYGNTSAATIPIALEEAITNGLIKLGDLVVLVAFGGGMTWASSLFTL